jgi:phosphoribosylaminoimidazole carboxylase (NCAIR synthetase)
MNLDAEEELESPVGYNVGARTAASVAKLLGAARALIAPGDVIVDHDGPVDGRGRVGKAWCPTPSAVRRLARTGAETGEVPSLAVLQRANHRRLCFEMGATLPGTVLCEAGAEALDVLLRRRSHGPFIVKRAFGYAGRGRRRIHGEPTADDRRWLLSRRSAVGLLVEPEVEVHRELCLHGLLLPSGHATFGRICVQECDRRHAWLGTTPALDLDPAVAQRLRLEGEAVASRLHAIGYFGPFGIDAYEYMRDGELRLNPRSEINARYTMGYPTGMAGRTIEGGP